MKIELPFLLKHTINHTTVPEKKRRGRKGYGTVKQVRLLVYSQSKGIHKDKQLVRHLNNNLDTAKKLGFKKIPHRTTIGRWKNRLEVQKSVFEFTSSVIQAILPTELLVVDSTPLVDYRDPEAEIGFYSRGPFKGFKAHLSVNQLGLPLKATVTKGNAHDSTQFNQLVEGLKANLVLGDSAYDSKAIRNKSKELGMKPVIDRNPRNTGKRKYTPKLLKKKRYIVEQFNAIFKNALDESWKRFKGIVKKASTVYCMLIAINIKAIESVISGSGLREVSEYWY